MANIKISQLPAASVVSADNDVLPMVHSGVTQKVTPNLLVQTVLSAPGPIGDDVAGSAAFTTLTASGEVTLNPANANVALSPTGSGAVNIQPNGGLLINPASVGSMNNVAIGGATPQPGTFTALTSTGVTTLNGTTIPSGTVLVDTVSAQAVANKTLYDAKFPDADLNNFYSIKGSSLAGNYDATLPVLTGNDTFVFANATQTLSNKTISGATNTITNIGNAALTNSSITIGSSPVSLGGTLSSVSGLSINSSAIGASAPSTGAFTTLSASSTVSGTGFSTYLASPPAIGGTTPAAGNFTTLGATGNTTLGDQNTDTLTINGTAVSIPNNLNFDSNTLFIDAANNTVGINTASPGARLHVVSAGNPAAIFESTSVATAGIEIRDGAATPNRWWLMSGLGSTTDGIFSIYDARQNLSRLAINTAGNVGIGTSSPSHKLDVSGTIRANVASNSYALLVDNGTYSGGLIPSSATGGLILYNAVAQPLGFWTNNVERMRIDSSGNLGLGVTPSASTLRGIDISTSGGFVGTSSSAIVTNNAYWNGSNWIYKNTASSGYYTVSGNAHSWFTAPSGTAGNAISFSQAMTLDASGNLLVGGTNAYGGIGRVVVTANPTAQWGLDFTGSQVTVANGANFVLPTGSGLVIVNSIIYGEIAAYLVGGTGVYKIGGHPNYVVGTTPAAGQISIGWNGSGYSLYSNRGASDTMGISMQRTRDTV